jgi:hypothetical protein
MALDYPNKKRGLVPFLFFEMFVGIFLGFSGVFVVFWRYAYWRDSVS